jgi:hypothetical protein
MIDLPEILACVGIGFLGYGLYLALGLPGLLGYVGVLLIVFGIFLEWARARPKRTA